MSGLAGIGKEHVTDTGITGRNGARGAMDGNCAAAVGSAAIIVGGMTTDVIITAATAGVIVKLRV